jgi:Leucine Rich repeats (2 copies)
LARAGRTLLARLGHLLQSLNLSLTKVTDLGPLRKGLTALELLDLSGTNVTDLGPVYDLPHLQIKANDCPPIQHFRNYRRERKLPY